MGLDVSFVGAFLAGVLSFLSPCVLPLVPPYLCFLAGSTLEELTGETEADPSLGVTAFVSASMFVLGFSAVFVALGASATWLGNMLYEHLPLLAQIAGVAIIIMGLHFLGVFRFALLNREARFHPATRPAGPFGAFAIGLAFAFGWTPCIGPILGAILGIAAGEEQIGYGAALLAVYSAGLGVPFLLAALAIKPFLNFMKNFRQHLGRVEKAMGGLLVITGVLFLSGAFTTFSFWLIELFPALGTIG